MDPSKLPFNAFIVGPANSGKSRFVVNQIYGPFRGKFDYIVLICPTFSHNKTYHRIGENDPRMFVIICVQHEVENWLKLVSRQSKTSLTRSTPSSFITRCTLTKKYCLRASQSSPISISQASSKDKASSCSWALAPLRSVTPPFVFFELFITIPL